MEKMHIPIKTIIAKTFDSYKSGEIEEGRYSHFGSQTLEAEQGIYHILMHVAVYAIGVAVLLVASWFVFFAKNKEKRAEGKVWLGVVFAVVVLIFSLPAVLQIIVAMGV